MNMKLGAFLNSLVFLIFVCVQIGTVQSESDTSTSKIKYIVCLIGIVLGLIIIGVRNVRPVMTYELRKILEICVLFAVITLFFSLLNGQSNNRASTELILMVLPIVYAFCLINSLSLKQIDVCMAIILIISICAYFVNLHMSPSEFLSAFLSANPAESYSALESSDFSSVSIALALYYLYFRSNKICCIISIFFVFCTFKRMAMLVVIILIFLPKFVDCSRPISKRVLLLAKTAFIIISVGYFILLTPDVTYWIRNHWGFDLDQFTMARSWRFRLVYQNPLFVNTGLGSTWTFLHSQWGFSMEMDIMRLFFEVTPIGACFLINNMLDIAKKNRYCFIVLCYLLFNLVTSHCLANMFCWLMIYLIIGTIIYRDSVSRRKLLVTIA